MKMNGLEIQKNMDISRKRGVFLNPWNRVFYHLYRIEKSTKIQELLQFSEFFLDISKSKSMSFLFND